MYFRDVRTLDLIVAGEIERAVARKDWPYAIALADDAVRFLSSRYPLASLASPEPVFRGARAPIFELPEESIRCLRAVADMYWLAAAIFAQKKGYYADRSKALYQLVCTSGNRLCVPALLMIGGVAYEAQGQYDRALEMLDKAISIYKDAGNRNEARLAPLLAFQQKLRSRLDDVRLGKTHQHRAKMQSTTWPYNN